MGFQLSKMQPPTVLNFISEIPMDGTVLALQVRDYHSDFYFLTSTSTSIRSQPYLSGDGTSLSMATDITLSPILFNYQSASIITTTKEICLVNKNQLLVYGHSAGPTPDRVFELHQLENNSATQVVSVTQLASDPSRDYLMHSCDFSGGAWFRSMNEAEEHAFFDAGTGELHMNNGVVSDFKLVSIVNSKRGHYLTSSFNPATNRMILAYSDPVTFSQ